MTYRVGIVGATGYTGLELIRLLRQHPNIQIEALYSSTYQAQAVTSVFPHLKGLQNFLPFDPDNPPSVDLLFLAVHHGQSHVYMPTLLEKGIKVIDLSADFRLKNLKHYEEFYTPHLSPSLIEKAVYGLPEFYKSEIQKTQLCANPGCYATSVILGLKPLSSLIKGEVVVDAKSGVSGAGRIPKESTSFCEVSGSFSAYGTGHHRHLPEMQQETGLSLFFSPHLLPMNRGILSSIYINQDIDPKVLESCFKKAYQDQPFIDLYGQKPISTQYVTGSNRVAIGWQCFNGKTVIFVALDNLIKGASGQAIQNMNVMLGLPETMGLMQDAFWI